MEFNTGRGAVRIYQVDPDGELVATATHQHPELVFPAAPGTQRR